MGYIDPDTNRRKGTSVVAAIFWLKCRPSTRWNDKPELDKPQQVGSNLETLSAKDLYEGTLAVLGELKRRSDQQQGREPVPDALAEPSERD